MSNGVLREAIENNEIRFQQNHELCVNFTDKCVILKNVEKYLNSCKF